MGMRTMFAQLLGLNFLTEFLPKNWQLFYKNLAKNETFGFIIICRS